MTFINYKMLFNEIPCYLFHKINSFLTNCEILKISEVCRRFNLLTKQERYFNFVNCGNCNSKKEANQLGHLGCLNYFITENHHKKYAKLFEEMHFHVFEWVLNKRFKNEYTTSFASYGFVKKAAKVFTKIGNIKCLKFLFRKTSYINEKLYKIAIENNQLECFKLFYEEIYIPLDNNILEIIFEENNIYIFEYLININHFSVETLIVTTIRWNNVRFIKLILDKYKNDSGTMDFIEIAIAAYGSKNCRNYFQFYKY